MLFSLYPTITLNYFVLCVLACLGTLQWSAARNYRLEISLLGRAGFGLFGQIAGTTVVLLVLGWFFAATPGLFTEGLAGGELSLLFGAGAVCALLITRLAGAFWQARNSSGGEEAKRR